MEKLGKVFIHNPAIEMFINVREDNLSKTAIFTLGPTWMDFNALFEMVKRVLLPPAADHKRHQNQPGIIYHSYHHLI